MYIFSAVTLISLQKYIKSGFSLLHLYILLVRWKNCLYFLPAGRGQSWDFLCAMSCWGTAVNTSVGWWGGSSPWCLRRLRGWLGFLSPSSVPGPVRLVQLYRWLLQNNCICLTFSGSAPGWWTSWGVGGLTPTVLPLKTYVTEAVWNCSYVALCNNIELALRSLKEGRIFTRNTWQMAISECVVSIKTRGDYREYFLCIYKGTDTDHFFYSSVLDQGAFEGESVTATQSCPLLHPGGASCHQEGFPDRWYQLLRECVVGVVCQCLSGLHQDLPGTVWWIRVPLQPTGTCTSI